MNVGELIELLQRADPALPIRVSVGTKIHELDDDATGFFCGTDDDHFVLNVGDERR